MQQAKENHSYLKDPRENNILLSFDYKWIHLEKLMYQIHGKPQVQYQCYHGGEFFSRIFSSIFEKFSQKNIATTRVVSTNLSYF